MCCVQDSLVQSRHTTGAPNLLSIYLLDDRIKPMVGPKLGSLLRVS